VIRRKTVSLAACCVLGIGGAGFLREALTLKPTPAVPSVKRSIAARFQATNPITAPVASKKEVLLLSAKTSRPEKVTPAPVPRLPAVSSAPEALVPPLFSTNQELPTISQPALSTPSPPSNLTLPSIPPVTGAEQVPTLVEDPFAGKTFEDKPGGNILVLGLHVNEAGVVLETRILVPSAYVLGDVAFALASRAQRWTSLIPPLLPGETRWIEHRIDQRYVNTPDPSALP
jgi:hypothetical protein